MNVSRVAGRQRAKYDENFARRMRGEMTAALQNVTVIGGGSRSPHAAPCDLDRVLQARLASRFEFRTIAE